jgi:hypothetical protein
LVTVEREEACYGAEFLGFESQLIQYYFRENILPEKFESKIDGYSTNNGRLHSFLSLVKIAPPQQERLLILFLTLVLQMKEVL